MMKIAKPEVTAKPGPEKANDKNEAARLAGGYEAQGFALAQRVLALSVNVSRDMARCVRDAFDLSPLALTACSKSITTALKQYAMDTQGIKKCSAKAATKSNSTATVYASNFTVICRAIAAGMDKDVAFGLIFPDFDHKRHDVAPQWMEAVGFTTWRDAARAFLDAQGAGSKRGRDPYPWVIKFEKWLDNNPAEVAAMPEEVAEAWEIVKGYADDALAAFEAEREAKKAKK